ncbi:non-ribosomal peptide synthetase, partial [Clostridium estertheticum]
TGVEYAAPRNEIEEKLVKVWSEVLGIEKIGIDDDFFTLGGHSLKAIQVVSIIHRELNVEVPVGEVFSNPTIRQTGDYIVKSKESIYSSIKVVEEREVYKVSSAQKRLFALNQFAKEETNYNLPSVMIVEGNLEQGKLEETFRKLIKRHEAFRTSFELENGEIVQKIHKQVEFNVEYIELNEAGEELIKGIVGSFIKPFDLSKAPLLRVKLVRLEQEKYIWMLDMHHIISDGISIGIIMKEFTKLYKGERLEKLRIQYKDYAAWQNELLDSENMKEYGKYWMKAFSDELPVLEMPLDYQRPTLQSFEGESIEFKIDKKLTENIRKIGATYGATTYMTLLSAYNILLSRYSGQEDIIVGSPIAGR